MKSRFTVRSFGQATIEYLFVMIFLVLVSIKLVGAFSDFMRDSVGNLGHVLTMNLTTGVCQKDGFFSNYKIPNKTKYIKKTKALFV